MNMKKLIGTCFISATIAASSVTVSFAQAPTRIKQHSAWGAYTHTGSKGKVCYVLSVPTQKEPSDRDHGDVFFMVAKHPGQNVNLEPQFTVGYPFAENSKVTLNIDGKAFAMFTKGSNAWMENPAEEPTVVAAMRAGSKMSISGQSRRGTKTNYAYSLSGVTASLKEIDSCT
ncbi:MAG: invasion associated locus B family protein [Pseudomonadota bacterium]